MIRTYSELKSLSTFKDRFKYLKLAGNIGQETFGYDRYLNQLFYKSSDWLQLRNKIFVRDHGCDLGIEGYDIFGRFIIHHMNPLTIEDVVDKTDFLLNPEYLISTKASTHRAIHYGDEQLIILENTERRKNDTCPWRNNYE